MGGSSGNNNTPTVTPTPGGGLANSGGSMGGGSMGAGGSMGMGSNGLPNMGNFGTLPSTGSAPYTMQQGSLPYNPSDPTGWYSRQNIPTYMNGMPVYNNATLANNAMGAGNWSWASPYANNLAQGGGQGKNFGVTNYQFAGTGQPLAPNFNPNVQGSTWASNTPSAFGMTPRGVNFAAPQGANPNSNYSSAANIIGGGAQGGGYAPMAGGGGGAQVTQGSTQQGPADINFLMQQIRAGGGNGIGGFGLNGRPIGT